MSKKKILKGGSQRMTPSEFIERINFCPSQREMKFCTECRLAIRFQETDGHISEGVLESTIMDSIKLVGSVPHNRKFISWVEVVPPCPKAACMQKMLPPA